MHRSLPSFLGLLVPLFSGATTYYVSGTGSDSNSGTSQGSPWRSIARVQQQMSALQPGDQVLFQRGAVYAGELSIYCNGTAAAPVTFGAYGTGEAPIISGGVPVTNWVQYQGNIWRAPIAAAVKYLMVNNEPMTLARYPNSGWLRNVTGSATQINAGPALNQSNGYWVGATVVSRTTNWCFETATVSAFSGGTLTFNAFTSNLTNSDWGFFLCNKLSELDMAGEWYYDASSGQVYLWAPGNANPNTLSVLGSVHGKGFAPGWQKQYLHIDGLCFQGQKDACISTEGSFNVTVSNCIFRHAYKAISSSGGNNTYIGNTINDIYATAINIYDDNTTIADNIMTDCGVHPGLGESVWGHMGINSTGLNNVIRGNRLDNIGYIGIVAGKNALIERNVVHNTTSILNDGGGIAFDNADGMIIQDNIVSDIEGDLESVATNYVSYYKISHGIYFGNTSIKNTIVRRNTVTRCKGAGIHVDHTQVSVNNQIRDNILFDNDVQLSLSDLSNNTGPGATPPYYVPNFNDVYSGNVMYSIRPEQLCLRQYNVHGPGLVDWGTFTNNKYFSPYEELSIYIQNTNNGAKTSYTLEHWQQARGEDAGSTRSPLRLSKYATTSELSSDLVVNGQFTTSVSGWSAFPANGQITRDMTYLDNGALKAYLPNNSLYDDLVMRNTDQFSMQNGQWYRMRFSLQSDQHGILRTGVKGLSQFSGPNEIHERPIPFSSERREVEIYFQSDLTDQAVLQYTNLYLEPRYWLDNIQLHRVTVNELDPTLDHVIFVNDQSVTENFVLPSGCWSDVEGNLLNGPQAVPAYSSKIIYRVPGEDCGVTPLNLVGAKVLLSGPLNWSTGIMNTDLRSSGLIPSAEPYSAMGIELENTGATMSPVMLQLTGGNAIVDWVVLELLSPGGYAVAGRRAALLQADGDVITPDGGTMIPFNVTTQGKYLVIRHRNHLAAMCASQLSSNSDVVDMTSASTAMFGEEPLNVQGGVRAMWCGDVNGDGKVQYTGAANDRDEVLTAIGSVVPSNSVQGYQVEDVNLDGWSKYTGAANDRDLILQTVGGVVPTAIRLSQAP